VDYLKERNKKSLKAYVVGMLKKKSTWEEKKSANINESKLFPSSIRVDRSDIERCKEKAA